MRGAGTRRAIAEPETDDARAIVHLRPEAGAVNASEVFCPTLDEALDLARYLRPVGTTG